MTGSATTRTENAARIRRAFERNAKAVELRPSAGRGTAVTTVRLRDGLECQIEDGKWSLTADMSESHGGGGAGPDPGVFGRAGLGSCLAAGYAMWAARRAVPMEWLTVRIEADYDARGELGVDDDISPAYSEVRVIVTVASDAPEAEVREVISEAEAHSPWLAVFREPVSVSSEVRFDEPGS